MRKKWERLRLEYSLEKKGRKVRGRHKEKQTTERERVGKREIGRLRMVEQKGEIRMRELNRWRKGKGKVAIKIFGKREKIREREREKRK